MLKLNFFRLALLAVLVSLFSIPARADTVYTYAGNEFTSGGSGSISGSFNVASPLGDNLSFTQISPESFSFTNNNGFTLTNLTADPNYTSIDVSTNSSGGIIDWSISLYSDNNQQLYTFNNSSWSYDFTTTPGYYSVTGNPGSWTVGATVTPEPSSLLLLSLGLTSLVVWIRWFKPACFDGGCEHLIPLNY